MKDVTEDPDVKDVTEDPVVRNDVTEDIVAKPDDSPALCEQIRKPEQTAAPSYARNVSKGAERTSRQSAADASAVDAPAVFSKSRSAKLSLSTTGLLSRKVGQMMMILACGFLMRNQPIFTQTNETNRESMDRFLGDVLDKEIESYSLCKECTRRSRSCQDCKFHNSQRSIKEIQETELLWDNMSIIQNPFYPNDKT